MQVVVFGGTGLVGQALARHAAAAGHQVFVPSRTPRAIPYGQTIPYTLSTIPALFPASGEPYAVVNLAGESLQSGRWTAERKRRILDSRVELTAAIAEAVRATPVPPVCFVSGSAVGYYGTSDTRTFVETDGPGEGFLADVCRAWEAAAAPACERTRVVRLRIGLVLSSRGGAFPKLAMPYRLGLGGPLGSGRQWVSWIHEDDLARLALWCLDRNIAGPVNGTAPDPLTMDDLGRTVAAAMRKPHWLPVPSAALRLVLGETAEMLLSGQRVLPEVALDGGFTFQYPAAAAAVRAVASGRKVRQEP
ncbi:MAG: TIGR01777 family oxidoreductase [Alicyclobacillus sp.]|nr:TIGR01777 family oxidoreductase [Alicyclobacillus sp.]